VIVVVVIALVAGYFGLRPEKAGAVGKNSPNFPKNSNSISVPGFGEQQPDRDINHIQRVALDTEHPQAPPVKPAPPAPPPVPAPTPAPVAPPPPAAPGVQQWQFEGQAYDLITLKPIPGATLSFRVSGNDAAAPVPVKTDANGRFKAFFQAMPGGAYELTASHPDYLDGYIDEMSPPLKEADLGDRRMLAASAGRNTRWAGRGAKGIDKRDIILIPKLIPEDAQ
jgi:hypothetical protein